MKKIYPFFAFLSFFLLPCCTTPEKFIPSAKVPDATVIAKNKMAVALVFDESQMEKDTPGRKLMVDIMKSHLQQDLQVVDDRKKAQVLIHVWLRSELVWEPITNIPYWYSTMGSKAVYQKDKTVYWDFVLRSGERSSQEIVKPVSAVSIGNSQARQLSIERLSTAVAHEIRKKTYIKPRKYFVQFIDFDEGGREKMESVLSAFKANNTISILDQKYGGDRFFEYEVEWLKEHSSEKIVSVILGAGAEQKLVISPLSTSGNTLIFRLDKDKDKKEEAEPEDSTEEKTKETRKV